MATHVTAAAPASSDENVGRSREANELAVFVSVSAADDSACFRSPEGAARTHAAVAAVAVTGSGSSALDGRRGCATNA